MGTTKQTQLQNLLWGAVLVTIGVVITLGNFGYGVGSLWRYSPLILVAMGIAKIIQPDKDEDRISGLTTALFGVWLLCNFMGIFGLSFSSSWPLMLIIIGLGIVLRSLIRRPGRQVTSGEDTNG